MIKLETKRVPFGGAFYFYNMADCEAFMYVFKDHWCNVPWRAPVEVPDWTDITDSQRKAMDKNPKQRAESNLSWGFSLCRALGIDLNDDQKVCLAGLMKEL